MKNMVRLQVYFSEKDHYQHLPLYKKITEILKQEKIIGVTVFRGIYGYGAKKHIHTIDMVDFSSNLPILIESIDERQKIEKALEKIRPILESLKTGLILMEPVEILFSSVKEEENV